MQAVPLLGDGQCRWAIGRVVHRGVVAGRDVRRVRPDERGVREPGAVLSIEPLQEAVGEELRDRVLGGAFVLRLQREIGVVDDLPVVAEGSQPCEPGFVAFVEAQQLLEAGQHAFPVRQARVGGVGDLARVGALIGVPEHHRVVATAHSSTGHVVEAEVEGGAVGDHSVGHLVGARVQRSAAGGAGCRLCVVAAEAHTLSSDRAEVGRANQWVAGAGERVSPELVEGDEEYVRAHVATRSSVGGWPRRGSGCVRVGSYA